MNVSTDNVITIAMDECLDNSGVWLREVEDTSFEDDTEAARHVYELIKSHIEGLDRCAAKGKILSAGENDEVVLNHTREALLGMARLQRRDCPQGQPKKRTYRANAEPVINRLAEDCCALFQFIEGERNLAEIKKMFPTSSQTQTFQSPALTRSRTLSTIDEEGDHDQDVVIRILAENAKLRDQLKYELKETNERLTKMEDITKRQDKARADIADECDRQIQSIQFALTDNKDAQSKQQEDIDSLKGKLKRIETNQVKMNTSMASYMNRIHSLETEIQACIRKTNQDKDTTAEHSKLAAYVQNLAHTMEERIKEQECALSNTHSTVRELRDRLGHLEGARTTDVRNRQSPDKERSKKLETSNSKAVGPVTGANRLPNMNTGSKMQVESYATVCKGDWSQESEISSFLRKAKHDSTPRDQGRMRQIEDNNNPEHNLKTLTTELTRDDHEPRTQLSQYKKKIPSTTETIVQLDPSPIRSKNTALTAEPGAEKGEKRKHITENVLDTVHEVIEISEAPMKKRRVPCQEESSITNPATQDKRKRIISHEDNDDSNADDMFRDFIGVERRRIRRKRFFLGYMKKNDPKKLQQTIYKYAQHKGVQLSFVRLMPTKQRDLYFARINVPLYQAHKVVGERFWPPGITCREWLSERKYKGKEERDAEEVKASPRPPGTQTQL
ncbi:uncharacterized protein LOC144871993 [Branchiostoma floridae x Branchiostoma japonicum]